MSRKSLLPLLACLLPALSNADSPGLRLGAAYWDYDVSGTLRYQSSDPADDVNVSRDLGYGDGDAGIYYIALEHSVPLLPNIRVSRVELDESATGMLSNSFDYGGVTFVADEQVRSNARLEQTDITFYYRVLDTVANIDLGVNAKYIDSHVSINGTLSGRASADVSGWVPMMYAGLGIELPLTGLSVATDGAVSSWHGSDFYDFAVKASYTTPWHLGIEAGYLKTRLNLDDFDGSYADVDFDGPFAGIYIEL